MYLYVIIALLFLILVLLLIVLFRRPKTQIYKFDSNSENKSQTNSRPEVLRCRPDHQRINGVCVQLACRSNSDCLGGSTRCLSGRCVAKRCTTSENCDQGESCIKNYCDPGEDQAPILTCPVPERAICQVTTDCSITNPYCVNGKCTCRPGEYRSKCTSGADCQSGTCLKGICIHRDGNCRNNDDCDVSQPYCTRSVCSTNILNSYCSNGKDCQGLYCVNSTCQKDPGEYGDQCLLDRDCQKNLVCGNGYCIPASDFTSKSVSPKILRQPLSKMEIPRVVRPPSPPRIQIGVHYRTVTPSKTSLKDFDQSDRTEETEKNLGYSAPRVKPQSPPKIHNVTSNFGKKVPLGQSSTEDPKGMPEVEGTDE